MGKIRIINLGRHRYDKKLDEFICPECGFRTIDEGEMIEHCKKQKATLTHNRQVRGAHNGRVY
uniref:Uncharacterized protein n=1 Tax=viral metagenome TaxID=1070528 RepID=A0A6M3LW55_9ZZZZ